MTTRHNCGRRGGASSFKLDPEGLDGFNERDGRPVCSYCGSISEEKFWELVDAGATVEPTDKSYKAYVSGEGVPFTKFYFQHLSELGMQKFVDYVNGQKFKLAFPGHFYSTPFFVMYTGTAPLQE